MIIIPSKIPTRLRISHRIPLAAHNFSSKFFGHRNDWIFFFFFASRFAQHFRNRNNNITPNKSPPDAPEQYVNVIIIQQVGGSKSSGNSMGKKWRFRSDGQDEKSIGLLFTGPWTSTKTHSYVDWYATGRKKN